MSRVKPSSQPAVLLYYQYFKINSKKIRTNEFETEKTPKKNTHTKNKTEEK